MDGFAKMIKMKVGGSVSKAVSKMCGGGKSYKSGGDVDDETQDKKLIKKAFKQQQLQFQQSQQQAPQIQYVPKGQQPFQQQPFQQQPFQQGVFQGQHK